MNFSLMFEIHIWDIDSVTARHEQPFKTSVAKQYIFFIHANWLCKQVPAQQNLGKDKHFTQLHCWILPICWLHTWSRIKFWTQQHCKCRTSQYTGSTCQNVFSSHSFLKSLDVASAKTTSTKQGGPSKNKPNKPHQHFAVLFALESASLILSNSIHPSMERWI